MRMDIIAATFAAFASCGSAAAQDGTTEVPLVKDIPPSDGYGAHPPDVLGIPFGASRDDAIAALKAAYPDIDIQQQTVQLFLRDGRGNNVQFNYPNYAVANEDGPPQEHITMLFTTGASGNRLYDIERDVDYPTGQYASLDEVRASLDAKYGKPTVTLTDPAAMRLIYVWEKHPVKPLGTVDRRSFGSPDPCFDVPGQIAVGLSPYTSESGAIYSYREPGTRKDAPRMEDCIGAIRIDVYFGGNDKTVSGLHIEALDYDRAMRDARALDTVLTKALSDKSNAVQGQGAPKL